MHKSIKDNLKSKWERYPKTSYFIVYSILFCILCLFVFGYFAVYRKSFIYTVDGLSQHANSLAYYGEYLRGIFKELFVNHKFTIPMWDMNIGYGSDILTTLHYYVIGDPLTLLAVFCPVQYTEILYIILILLRFYLCGLTFSYYCYWHKNERFYIVLGALVYCFSGYALYAGIRHPYFLNPMIYLPLILIGIDKIFNKERPYLFVISVFIAAISNFYFFYMICIFMLIYAVFRYIEKFEKIKLKDVIPWFLRFVGYFLLALGLASVIFLPVITSMLGSGRLSAKQHVPFLYERGYYERFLTAFMAGRQPGYWSVMGFTPIVLVSIFVLFTKKKENKYLKICFILLTSFLFIPFIGHAINGFSYVSNRWIWAYGLLNAYILVKMLPELFKLVKREKNKLILFTMVYILLCLISRNARTIYGMGAVFILMLIELFLFIDKDEWSKRAQNVILLLCVCVGIIWSSYSLYSVNMINYTDEYHNLSYFNEVMQNEKPSDLIKELNDDTVFRFNQYGSKEMYNLTMQQKLNGVTFYFSMNNSYVGEFFREHYINFPFEQKYNGLDQRAILDSLAAVKYYLVIGGKGLPVPYNFIGGRVAQTTIKGQKFVLFQNKNELPIGYTYESYINKDTYDSMTVTEKQQAVLQGCVLSESSFTAAQPVYDDINCPFEVQQMKGIEIQENRIIVRKSNASMTLEFDGVDNAETYLIVENLHIEGIHPIEAYTEKEWNQLSKYSQKQLINKHKYYTEPASYIIDLKTENVSKSITSVTDRNNFYGGKHDYLCNLGYAEEAITEVTVTFPKQGIYSFDDIRIVCQPMEKINDHIDLLKRDTLNDVVVSNNMITGNIMLEQPKILTLSIPYSKGWSAYVDGDKTEIMRANTMYMAVELGEGYHTIEFIYVTPFLKQGGLISVLSFIVFICMIIYFEMKGSSHGI